MDFIEFIEIFWFSMKLIQRAMAIPSIIILLGFQTIWRLFKRCQYLGAFLKLQIHIELKNAVKYVQVCAAELALANATVKCRGKHLSLIKDIF